MKFERFDSQKTFETIIRNGIDLFLGSGFSIGAEDAEGVALPVGNGLLEELKCIFSQIKNFSSLSMAGTVLEASIKEDFHKYLSRRFAVEKFSDEYRAILKLKIQNIYTTNIDDLIYKIFENSDKYYINNTSERGYDNGKNAINYSPLHGCVRYPSKGYIFSKTKIASAYSDQREDWNNLRRYASNAPILFWGWSFDDSDVIEALYSNNSGIGRNTDKWIILYRPNDEEVLFYEALGLNIIISETIQMLKYINDLIIENEVEETEKLRLPEYEMPSDGKELASYPLTSFFKGDSPRWSHIFSGEISKTHHFSVLKNYISANKNIFVIGIPASGKTTLFMQMMAEYSTEKNKHMLISPTLEEAKIYVNKIGTSETILFVDSCFRDIEAMCYLLSISNIQLVGFDRDYLYEANSFRLRNTDVDYELCDITEINIWDKRNILDTIPNDCKKTNTTIKTDPTIFSLLSRNLKGPRFEKIFKNAVNELYKTNTVATELFVMICYVHSCGVPVSYDMIYSYLRDEETDYLAIYDIIDQVGKIIIECSDEIFNYLNVDFSDQDYYQSRSRYFAELIIRNIPANCPVLKKVLFTFIKNVPAFKICEYDVFKRKGYDADFAVKAFHNIKDAIDFYNLAAQVDETEYLYQQAALCFSRMREYTLAFRWIDKARNITAYNRFSIDNTHAIIQFKANKDVEDTDGSVKALLINSLETLKKCYENDRRKPMHVKSFAQLSKEFFNRYGYEDSIEFLQLAIEWIEIERENIDIGTSFKRELFSLENDLKKIVDK